MKLVFTPEADEQAEESDLWWRANRPKAPGLFASELAAAKAFIVNTPKLGKVYAVLDCQQMRRVLLHKTGHHVYYTIEPDVITVHSVWGAPRGRGPKL
jgi:hypothetical protein